MPETEFFSWLKNTLGETNWPNLNSKLFSEPEALKSFLHELKTCIEKWLTATEKNELPLLINDSLRLNGKFSTPYTVKASRNFIVSLIQRGNQSGVWNLPVPQLAILNFRQQNPFQDGSIQNYSAFHPVFERFLEDIKSNRINQFSTEQQLGMSIFCFVYFGGLLRMDLLTGLLQNVQCYQHDIQYGWIDFIEDDQVYFRWHPDPLSELYVTQYLLPFLKKHDIAKDNLKPTILSWINDYLSTMSENLRLDSLRSLFKAVEIHYHLNFPEAVTFHLQNPFRSTPLPVNAWRRYRDLPVKPIESENADETVIDAGGVKSYPIQSIDLIAKDQNKILTAFRKEVFTPSDAMGKKDSPAQFAKKCQRFLQTHQDSMTQPVFYLVQWLAFQVGNGLKISSAGTYLSQVKSLVLSLLNINFADVESEALIDAYNEAITEKQQKRSVKYATYVSSRIKSFHIFLYLYAKAPEIPFDELLYNQSTGKQLAKANILSNSEIKKIKAKLAELDERFAYMFMLAVRLGLRMKEVLNLQFKHFIGWKAGYEMTVLITNTEFHNTKTASGRRKISLQKYLTKQEYFEFKEFYTRQREQIGVLSANQGSDQTANVLGQLKTSAKAFVFSNNSQQPPERSEVEQNIVPIMRENTQDNTLTFHSLRHSFVNHNLLKLFLMPESLKRDALKAFSYEVGHLSPDETLKTYFHLMPVVVNFYLNRNSHNLLQLSVPNVCELFEKTDQKFTEKVYKRAKKTSFPSQSIIEYYRKENLPQYLEPKIQRKRGAKQKTAITCTQTWIHPKLFFLCLTSDLNNKFLERLAHVNNRPVNFYKEVSKLKEFLIKQIDSGARGLDWPKGLDEEKILLETYRKFEQLSDVNKSKFRTLFSQHRDKKNLIFETDKLSGAIRYCGFLAKLSTQPLLIRLTASESKDALPKSIQAETWLKQLQKNNIPAKQVWIVGVKTPVQSVSKAKTHTQGKISITINNGHDKASHGFKMGIVLALSYDYFLQQT